MQIESYQDVLKSELLVRCGTNSSYSLRAYARDLELDPSHLSRVLNNKQSLSLSSARRISEEIFKEPTEQDYFVTLVEYSTAKKSKSKERALERLISLSQRYPRMKIAAETLNVICDWYYFPILEICALPKFDSQPKKIASFLGLSMTEAKLAIEKLHKLGLIKEKNGRWRKTQSKMKTSNNQPSEALRKYHKQVLQKAIDSVDEQPLESRYIRARTMTTNKEALAEIRGLVEEFFEKVSRVNNKARGHDSVYQMSFQLFDLNMGDKNEKN